MGKFFKIAAIKFFNPGKEVQLVTKAETVNAFIKQPHVRKELLNIYKTKRSKKIDRELATELLDFSKREARKDLTNNLGRSLISRKGKKYPVVFKHSVSKKELPEIIAHENFHAKVPILGNSEFLAHLYGGIRSKRIKEALTRYFINHKL